MMLPTGAEAVEEDEPDPRRELVKQLLEYRKFKDAAGALEERAEQQSTRLPRQEPPDPTPAAGPKVKPVELWDLASAFARLMRETQALQTTKIAVDDTPHHPNGDHIKDPCRAAGPPRPAAP